ncbi:MAG: potassium-transporting ATPase subunit KdpC [Bryobacteraceae bacterium]
MWQQLLPALRMTALMTVLTGLIYPLAVTGIAQIVFPGKANGSLIQKDGHIIGSTLIGQKFTKPEYFHPRPSAAGSDGYDAAASGGSNLGPTSKKLADRVQASVEQFHKDNPKYNDPVPADLLTASASGLDPHISPASAEVQVERIASARGVMPEQVRSLVLLHTEHPDLGFLGEPRVNVLLLNLDLDQKLPAQVK